MRTFKNLSQLFGAGMILFAAWSAWQGLPVRQAILDGASTLATVEGPGADIQLVTIAQELPMRLGTSPWFLLGIVLVLIPYLVQIAVEHLGSAQEPATRRY